MNSLSNHPKSKPEYLFEILTEEEIPITELKSNCPNIFKQSVINLLKSKHHYEVSPKLIIKVTLPNGEMEVSHSKNKITGFNDLMKILRIN